MTIPEAIKWFAAKLMVNESFGLLGPQNEAAKLALAALQEQEERKANLALTLEDLRKMDGEPVWVTSMDGESNIWAFVDVECSVVRIFAKRYDVKCMAILRHFRTYGKTWRAYRRKPEEGKLGDDGV